MDIVMKCNLISFVKYCLGYVKLTKKRILASSKNKSLNLSLKYLDVSQLLVGDQNSDDARPSNVLSPDYLVKLDTFYKYSPEKVPTDKQVLYDKEKALANKIEELNNIYREDQYTKQIFLEFGCFEVELPVEIESLETEKCDTEQKITMAQKPQVKQHRLFCLPVKIEKKIEKDIGRYFIYPVDTEIQINLDVLEPILGEDLYFQVISQIGKYEHEGRLRFPMTNLDIFQEIWNFIKAQLRLKDINFNEQSFDLKNVNIVISPRSNYFLSEDLDTLANLSEEELEMTSLSSWTKDEGLNIDGQVPHERQLYFPFDFDKFQLDTLSLLNNKCSIIQGPPGTGKSTTIANILSHLAANGKRVLFVSQKAQALKVVKDKLKSLDVQYLFSYVPNMSSAQLDESDEADGVAPQLSSLGGYIEKLKTKVTYRQNRTLDGVVQGWNMEKIVDNQTNNRHNLNQAIENQRKYHNLDEQHKSLEKYDISLADRDVFLMNVSSELIHDIFVLYQQILELEAHIQCFKKNILESNRLLDGLNCDDVRINQKYSKQVILLGQQYDAIYPDIEVMQLDILTQQEAIYAYGETLSCSKYFNQMDTLSLMFDNTDLFDINLISCIVQIKADVLKNAYDGHNSIARYISNSIRSFRLTNLFNQLPRELRNYIKPFIDRNISKNDAVQYISFVETYLNCFDKNETLKNQQDKLHGMLYQPMDAFRKNLPAKTLAWVKARICKLNLIFDDIEKIFTPLVIYFQDKEKAFDLELLRRKFDLSLNQCGLSMESFILMKSFEVYSTEKDIQLIHEEVVNNMKLVQQIIIDKARLQSQINAQQVTSSSSQSLLQKERKKCISAYIQNALDDKILKKWEEGIAVKQVIRKLATVFKKSKKAFKTFDTLRNDPNNLKQVLDFIPIWIMELDDASRILPLEKNLFDYVILDEASQCNIAYALPVMYRTQKVLFVGDSEQMRDSTVSFKKNRDFDELARRYQIPEDNRIKTSETAVQSVLDIAYKRGFTEKTLQYHYRSPVELIGFCNESFYKPKGKELFSINNNYITYKDTNRVMLIHEMESDGKDEINDFINVAEAEYALKLFKELRADEKYKNKSIGILSFFSSQVSYLRKLFEELGFNEVDDNYKICNIDGVQGDEKDIIIYSFVIRNQDQKNKYTPLTGEGGDINGELNRGRVNVAFSRAREQIHCLISLSVNQMPDKIWIKKYLEYVQEYGLVKHNATDLQKFDSYFEETFYAMLHNQLDPSYRIQNQIESCGFKIDFVVSNTVTGKRLAIECDGPCHFEDEADDALGFYIENDEHRQRILESAGWHFYRVKYSDWINREFDKKDVVRDIISLLS